MTGFEEDAIESALVDEPLNQRSLKGNRVAIPMRRALAKHGYLHMTKRLSCGIEGVFISRRAGR
jgi:hypothetical protein